MTLTAPFNAIADTIFARLDARITTGGDGGAAVHTVWPNSKDKEPSSGLWIRPVLRDGQRQQAEIGGGVRSRTVGVLFVEISTNAEGGTKTLTDLAERVRAAFDRWSSTSPTGIQFRTCSLRDGVSGERHGNWWRIVVVAPFYADDGS
jgi:sirohydrochlorin ferrochelatase